MKIYDSLTNQLQELALDKTKVFNMYMCGPTVYNYIHVGNARPNFTVDFFVRFLESEGYQVNYLQNITDIDDKIINKALETHQDELMLSKFYADAYLKDLAKLNVRQPNKIIRVSEVIPELVEFISQLNAKKAGYQIDQDVYFAIDHYKDQYGKLSGRKLADLIASERVEPNPKKESPLDFALWKETVKGLKWDTPFGAGRPGWHTECVVMIDDYFNHQPIDLHAGGIDLKFPHHENERIQFWAMYEKELAKTWMHNGHLTFNNEKMSKSIGNVILVKDFLRAHDPNLLRLIFMTTSFTQPLDLTDDLINQGEKFFIKLTNLQKKAKQAFALDQLVREEATGENLVTFRTYMNDNLNTPMVLTLIEQMIKEINTCLSEGKLIGAWDELNEIFGILGFTTQLSYEVSAEDKTLFVKWNEAVKAKDFKLADQLREELKAKGLN